MEAKHLLACAVLAASVGSGTVGAAPPNARRTSPPPGLAERAVPIGSPAPALDAAPVGNGTFSWSGALERGPVVVVFYRGHW